MSYISTLNLLDGESPTAITDDIATEELYLWANAQFTFDTEPGSALQDDLNSELKTKEANAAQCNDLLAGLSDLGEHQPSVTSFQDKDLSSFMMSGYLLPQLSAPVNQEPPQRTLPRLAPAILPNNGLDANWLSQQLTPTEQPASTTNGRKRKQPAEIDPLDKAAAEEDKRRRNTAASARFRMKKKLREQALERTAKEMASKTEALEKRVKELEMEAKWLRALVIEKDPKLLELPESS